MNKFTKEAKKELIKQGYVIYTLQGKTIEQMRKTENIYSTWTKGMELEGKRGYKGEIAILPSVGLIPGSTSKTYAEQQEFIKKYSKEHPLLGTKVEILDAASYLEVMFAHFHNTNEYMLGENHKANGWWPYTRSSSQASDGHLVSVGDFGSSGASVYRWRPDFSYSYMGVVLSRVPLELDSLDTQAWENEFDILMNDCLVVHVYDTKQFQELKAFIKQTLDQVLERQRDEIFRKMDDPNFKPKPNTNNFAVRNAMFKRFIEILDSLGKDKTNENHTY